VKPELEYDDDPDGIQIVDELADPSSPVGYPSD
jgi:hypothetical protein